ncbi:FAD binding domain-containing protein [Actinokineospora sp. HUAS TT18]|uniref:FAD binding domain-containing protein n=1 Tax=Actinokineospora sp. HUAS TT18 TaxID=3447451 RepID=UPI003F51B9C0
MITFLGSLDTPIPDGAVLRAGGTDLQERLRSHNLQPDIVDLTGVPGFAGITRDADGVTVGAGTPIAVVARELRADYPALALTAGSLATPQIRAVGTIGGNLLQRTRCWYYRHPDLRCHKSGGDTCPSRTGRHLYGVVFDNSACVHPHPSSLAMALLTYDASVTLASGTELTVAALLGDGVDPTRDHQLPDGEIVASVRLPAPWPERAAYFRAISRFEAEWPLVEAVARVRLDADGLVADCGIGLGGVATVPLRARAAEELLRGARLDEPTIERVSQACAEGATPLRETGYKVDLVVATAREVLERLAR